MDLLLINTVVSLISAVAMFVAIIYILTYMLGSFSSRSGSMSPRVVLFSLSYFFGSTVLLFLGVEWSALAVNALLHILCGFLTAFLYLKGNFQDLMFRRRKGKRARSS
jgi:hypothetical protein